MRNKRPVKMTVTFTTTYETEYPSDSYPNCKTLDDCIDLDEGVLGSNPQVALAYLMDVMELEQPLTVSAQGFYGTEKA